MPVFWLKYNCKLMICIQKKNPAYSIMHLQQKMKICIQYLQIKYPMTVIDINETSFLRNRKARLLQILLSGHKKEESLKVLKT